MSEKRKRREDGSIPRADPHTPLDEFGEGIEKDIVDPDIEQVLEETTEQNYGARELREELQAHTATSPILSGGDVDADWQSGETVGDETVGGSVSTPDQDRVDEIGQGAGIVFGDREELHSKTEENDAHRWELDPRSSPDYNARVKRELTRRDQEKHGRKE